MQLNAVFMQVPEGYIAFVEEARENLREAVELILEANRELAQKTLNGKSVIREPFGFDAI